MGIDGFDTLPKMMAHMATVIKDDDTVYLHRKHCKLWAEDKCVCDPIKMTGKEVKDQYCDMKVN